MEHIQAALDKARQRYGGIPRSEPVRADIPYVDGYVRPAGANALSWRSLQPAGIQLPHLVRNRIVTADKSDEAHGAFDRLRTRVLQEMRNKGWTSVAITSPTAGCGKSVVALNLAFSLGHQDDCRSLVIDLDLGRTRMADILGLERAPPLEDFLTGALGAQAMFVRHGVNLAFAANGRCASFTAELLHSASTARVLAEACRELQPDIVIYDMPPMLCGDDTMAFLPHVDCVILVAAAEASTFAETDLCESELAEKSNLLGVVLNKCRYPQDQYGY